jgi:hypothetical protein
MIRLALLIAVLLPAASAQVSVLPWQLDGPPCGSGTMDPTTLQIVGPDQAGCPFNSVTAWLATAPYDLTVSADSDFKNHDTDCVGHDWEVYVVDGVSVKFGDIWACGGSLGRTRFTVQAGSSFGFGVQSDDAMFGPGVLDMTNLRWFPRSIVHTTTSGPPGGRFGAAVTSLGDITGDGVPDYAAGQPDFDELFPNAGRVIVFDGATGLELFDVEGESQSDRLGESVAGVGLVDGDAVPDLLVGAPGADVTGDDAGRAVVLSGVDGSVIHVFDGLAAGDAFGTSVAGAGDVNGDGRGDLLIGAPGSDIGGTDIGMAFLYSGLDATEIDRVRGDEPGDLFGTSIAGGRDVDGDLVPDAIVGAPLGGPAGVGQVVVLSGVDLSTLHVFEPENTVDYGSVVAFAGDVDADGTVDIVGGSPSSAYSGPAVLVHSGASGNLLYALSDTVDVTGMGISVAGLGDVNGDGYDDFAAGARRGTLFNLIQGSVVVFSGRDGSWLNLVEGFGNPTGITQDDGFGTAVAAAGDVDGDGRPDLLVGSNEVSGPFLIPGRVSVVSLPVLWTPLADGLAGTHGAPQLAGEGLLAAGLPTSLFVSGALENAALAFVIGLSRLDAPFKGGLLQPTADLIVSGLVTDSSGELSFSAAWPGGLPSRQILVMQAWIADPATPAGFSSTNGLQAQTP